jgi:hypothetical protein
LASDKYIFIIRILPPFHREEVCSSPFSIGARFRTMSSSVIEKEEDGAPPLYSGSGSLELRLLIYENVTPFAKNIPRLIITLNGAFV